MKYLATISTLPFRMNKIFLLLIGATFYFSSCDTADKTDAAIHVAKDSVQKDTVTTIVKTKQIESNDSTLEDGWHTIDHTNMGINRDFYGHEILNLPQKSFIPFADITDIKSELFIDGIDTARIITFDLTKNGEAAWQNMISNKQNDHIYFVLDDKLINLHKVFTNTDKKQAYRLELFLGYSDNTAQETLDIEARIREKLQK